MRGSCSERLVGGDWDVREDVPVDRTDGETDPDLYLSHGFSDIPLYQSLEAHFSRDVPWPETTLVPRARELVIDDQFDGSV